MVLMSVGSFYILFSKLFEQQRLMNEAKKVRAGFWNSSSLREAANKLDKNSAYRQLVEDGPRAQDQHNLRLDAPELHVLATDRVLWVLSLVFYVMIVLLAQLFRMQGKTSGRLSWQ